MMMRSQLRLSRVHLHRVIADPGTRLRDCRTAVVLRCVHSTAACWSGGQDDATAGHDAAQVQWRPAASSASACPAHLSSAFSARRVSLPRCRTAASHGLPLSARSDCQCVCCKVAAESGPPPPLHGRASRSYAHMPGRRWRCWKRCAFWWTWTTACAGLPRFLGPAPRSPTNSCDPGMFCRRWSARTRRRTCIYGTAHACARSVSL